MSKLLKKATLLQVMFLGKNYLTGALGLKQDTAKAKQYLQTASSQGFNDATVDLAVLYFSENTAASDQKRFNAITTLNCQRSFSSHTCQSLV